MKISYEESFDDIVAFFQDWVDASGVEVVNKFEAFHPSIGVMVGPGRDFDLLDDRCRSRDGAGVQVTLLVGTAQRRRLPKKPSHHSPSAPNPSSNAHKKATTNATRATTVARVLTR